MRRGERVTNGWVNFPLDDPKLTQHSKGLIVKLVVIDPKDSEPTSYGLCCGTSVYDLLDASLIGDDKFPMPEISDHSTQVLIKEEAEAIQRWEEYHFPLAYHDEIEDISKIMSRPYLASIVIGTSGWAGYHPEKGNWYCQYEDLTEEGKALYGQMELLYPGCDIHLLTLLDT